MTRGVPTAHAARSSRSTSILTGTDEADAERSAVFVAEILRIGLALAHATTCFEFSMACLAAASFA